MTTLLQIDYKNSLNSFDTTFPTILKEKGITQEEYYETLNYLSLKTSRILSNGSQLIPILFWILGLVLFISISCCAIILNFFYNKTQSFGKFFFFFFYNKKSFFFNLFTCFFINWNYFNDCFYDFFKKKNYTKTVKRI